MGQVCQHFQGLQRGPKEKPQEPVFRNILQQPDTNRANLVLRSTMQQRLLFWPSWLVTEEACNVINQPQLCRSHSKQKSTQEFETSIIQSMNQALH